MTKKLIPNLPFMMVRTLNGNNANNNNGETKPICPQCSSEFLRLRADNNSAVIRCLNCFWEEYYIRIRKNDNI